MKRALVLCGGGSKGSYETGAWRALDELGIHFDIVTGTSIGALNGAMYVQHDYQGDFELWDKIEVGMIMDSGFNFQNNSIRNELKNQKGLVSFFTKYVTHMGTDIKPFLKLMDIYLDVDKIKNSDVTFGICCAKFPSMKKALVVANSLKEEEIKKYILASASCFPVFPVCKIGKESFIDGGYYDNLPIDFAIDLGARDIVAIDLNPVATHPEYLHKPHIKYIKPTHSLGSFMLFDHKVIMNNFLLGYFDVLKAYGKCDGFRYNIEKSQKYHKYAIEFLLKITKMSAKINLKKRDEKLSLFYLLEEYTENLEMSAYDYILRATEICAELFNIDFYKLYSLDELITKIIDLLKEVEYQGNIYDEYLKMKSSKKGDYIAKLDSKKLLRYLYQNILVDIDLDFLIQICYVKPKIYISYELLKAYRTYLVNPPKEKGAL